MKNKLLTPGPVPLAPEIYQELGRPSIHHRTDEFSQILKEALSKLKLAFQTQNPVMILTSTGTGAMEAALTNCLSKGDKILFLTNGKFGERWVQMAQVFQFETLCLEADYGKTFCIKEVREFISQNKNAMAIFCEASETSTGTVNPFQEISKIVQQEMPHALFIIDGMTAVGALDIQMDRDNIDILIAGSQKAFALPTGHSFISLSEKARQTLGKSNIPKYYFDLQKEIAANKKMQTAFSSSSHFMLALNKSLDGFIKEKLDQKIKLCLKRQKAFINATREFSIELFSESPSPSLTALVIPKNINSEVIKRNLYEKYGLVVAGGQGSLKGKILRIGHMGEISKQDYKNFINAFFKELNGAGLSLSEENLQKALSHLDSL